MGLIVEIPMPIPSIANIAEHWSAKSRRAKQQRTVTAMVLRSKAFWNVFPCVVKVTRVAPRRLDGHDNLKAALKNVIDGIADFLDVNDADPRVQWDYDQDRGRPKYQAARIEIRGG